MLKTILPLFLTVFGVILAYFLWMFLFQSKQVYFPRTRLVAEPGDIGLEFESVELVTKDNINIHAWYIPHPYERAVILFCHGNAGNISHRLESIQLFHRLGLSTFIFDYRGYGRSKGKPSEKGTYLDAEAGWDYLVNEKSIPPEKIIVFGRSLGGAVAAKVAMDNNPGALISESAFSSIKTLASEMYPFLPVRTFFRFEYPTADYTRETECPILVVHSRDDEMIGINHAHTIFDAAKEPKEFLEISGSHNECHLDSGSTYEKSLDVFIRRFIE